MERGSEPPQRRRSASWTCPPAPHPASWTAPLMAAVGCGATERDLLSPAVTVASSPALLSPPTHQPCLLDPSSCRPPELQTGRTVSCGLASGLVSTRPPRPGSKWTLATALQGLCRLRSRVLLSPCQPSPGGVGACLRVPGRKVYVDIEYTSATSPRWLPSLLLLSAVLCAQDCPPYPHRVGECGNLDGTHSSLEPLSSLGQHPLGTPRKRRLLQRAAGWPGTSSPHGWASTPPIPALPPFLFSVTH